MAGGESRRMGRDKAALALAGEALVARMAGKLRSLGLPVRIAGLRTPIADLGVEVVPDRFPDCGPLGGLETALRESAAESVLALAVDLPLISPSFLRLLLERTERTGALATIPRVTGAPQPLCAVYHRSLHVPVEAALVAGDYKIMRVMEAAAVAAGGREAMDSFEAEAAWSAAGVFTPAVPIPLQFLNCNTPADVQSAEALASAPARG